jgi:hypothetical protein
MNNSKLKISFDFDHTLTNPKHQELAIKFIALNAEVHITTSRAYESPNSEKLKYDNREVFAMAGRLGIKKENITFTAYVEKYGFLKDFDLHFDDDVEEINLINQHPCRCIGVLVE